MVFLLLFCYRTIAVFTLEGCLTLVVFVFATHDCDLELVEQALKLVGLIWYFLLSHSLIDLWWINLIMIWFILHVLIHFVIATFSARLLQGFFYILFCQIRLLSLERWRYQLHHWIVTLFSTNQLVYDFTSGSHRFLLWWLSLHRRIVFIETASAWATHRAHTGRSSTAHDTLCFGSALYFVYFISG